MTADDLAAAFAALPPHWRQSLPGWTAAAQASLIAAIRQASGHQPIAPDDPFRALRLVAPQDVRVVVFGQDPYPGAGHADGLAFSAPTSTRPSLRRIFDVLEADKPGWKRPASGRLDAWAEQGVLLLNPSLTVETGRKNSHTNLGWQALTAQIVICLLEQARPPWFLLWGSQAQTFMTQGLADRPGAAPNAVRLLQTRHPSNDFKRQFMNEGSHFAATAHLVDWWALH